MGRAIFLAVVVVLALATPASARIVATDGDVALDAERRGGELCLAVAEFEACEEAPDSPFEPVTISDDGLVYAAAVVPEVTRVEIELRSGARRSLPTLAAPGFRSRFVLAARPGRVALARFYDAAGTLIGANEEDLRALERPSVLRSFADGTVVRVVPRRSLEPTATQPDRIVSDTCLRVRGAGRPCTDDIRLASVAVCGPERQTVYGTLPAGSGRVALRLGDGRTVAAGVVALPDGAGYAVQIPAGTAVRTLRATDAAGRTLAANRLGFPPCQARAVDDLREYRRPEPLDGPPVPVASASGHSLVAARSGDRLCAGIDRIQRPCLPGPDPEVFLMYRRGGTIGGIVAPQATTVRVGRRGGTDVTVATLADPAFPGARFFAAAVPPGRGIILATALAADGREVGTGLEFLPDVERLGTVARRRGRRLVELRVTALGERFRCIASAMGLGANGFCREPQPADVVSIEVGCAPRRQAMVFGRGPRAVVTLADGRRVKVKRLRLGGFVAFPPARAGIRAVTVAGDTTRVDLPPATEQCGYGGEIDIADITILD